MKKSSILIFLLCIICMAEKSVASSHVSFESLTTADGLVQNSIHSILQERTGYIWIGTSDGLNRYDGKRFISFTHKNSDSTSISDNYVEKIYEDHLGRIWVGTRSGLNIYNELSNSFIRVPLDSFSKNIYTPAITEDYTGTIWVGSDGAGLLSIKIDSTVKKNSFRIRQFLTEENDTSTLASNTIFALETDLLHNLWVGTEKGLCKLSFDQLSVPSASCKFERVRICDHNVCVFHEERVTDIVNHGNQIWFGTKGRFIYCLDYSNAKNTEWKIIKAHVKTIVPDADPVLTKMVFDNAGNLWLSYSNEGISELTFANDTVIETHYVHEKNNPSSLISNTCITVVKDHTNMLWVGTSDGISLFNPLKNRFHAKDFSIIDADTTDFGVSSFRVEYNRFYFFGTNENGLIIYDSQQKKSHRIKALATHQIYCIQKDDKGNFWMGTNSGVTCIRGSDLFLSGGKEITVNVDCPIRTLKKNTLSPGNSIQSNLVFSILQDHAGRLWIGTGQGLSYMDIATEKITHVDLNPNNTSLFAERIIRSLLLDVKNQLWIATDGGLFQYNLSTNFFQKINGASTDSTALPGARIVCFHCDFQNHLWVGTNGGGLCVYDPASNSFHTFSEKDGLGGNMVQSIQSDPSGNLWISTNKGLSRFDVQKKVFANYDLKDGLSDHQFNPGASMITSDGFIFFGSENGYNSFHPDSIKMNSVIPPVVITDFKVFDKSLFYDDSVMRSLLLTSEEINLKFSQNSFSFEFAALNYIGSQKNQYAVMLDGFDNNWKQLGSRNFISYTNLDPGCYTLRVKASNNDNVWNETGISIPIVITPPFFRTWWFRVALVLAISLLIYVYYREHIRSIENKKQKELALRQTELKEQFLANMSHEIRTPLNAIMGMTRLLHEKDPKPKQMKYLNAITQSSEHLLVLINDILDFSKIEAGKIELENIPFSIRDAINNVHTTLRFKAEEKGLTFSARISPEVPSAIIGDPVRLSQVLINLAGNAIKFTANGSVMITCSAEIVSKEQSRLTFQVIDTGVGIAEESIGKIFDSFTQENSSVSREFGGTGLGLAISKRLVEMHGGAFDVSSVKGEGSTFSISVPYAIAKEEAVVKEIETIDPSMRSKLTDLRVLLVDDNHFNQLVAIDTLELELSGVTVDVAENGEEAIEQINQKHYDIVLMDVQMPVMNGLDATRAIRQMPSPKNQTRIIAMTASAMKTEVERCFAAGMDDFVAKPFNTIELLKKMSRLVVKMKVVA